MGVPSGSFLRCVVLYVEELPEVDVIREAVRPWLKHRTFSSIPIVGVETCNSSWSSVDVVIKDHIRTEEVADEEDQQQLHEELSMKAPLDNSIPWWDIYRIRVLKDASLSSIVIRLHPSLGDIAFLQRVLCGAFRQRDRPVTFQPFITQRIKAQESMARPGDIPTKVKKKWDQFTKTLSTIQANMRSWSFEKDKICTLTSFKGRYCGERQVFKSRPIKVKHIESLSVASEGQFDDIVCSCLAGSLHKYLNYTEGGGSEDDEKQDGPQITTSTSAALSSLYSIQKALSGRTTPLSYPFLNPRPETCFWKLNTPEL